MPKPQFEREILSLWASKMRAHCGSQYMSDDFHAELRFLGIVASPTFVRQPEGNGCIERFFRTLKEQLLWHCQVDEIETLRKARRLTPKLLGSGPSRTRHIAHQKRPPAST